MTIYDVTMYCGESNMLRFRFLELAPWVDVFVVTEADFTFSGTRRELVFLQHIKGVADLFHRARVFYLPIRLDSLPASVTDSFVGDRAAWARETFCRNYAGYYLRTLKLQPADRIILADLDEIPDFRCTALKKALAASIPVSLLMQFFYYSFNWQKKSPWCGAIVLGPEHLGEPLEAWRRNRQIFSKIISGWHCSYFHSPEEIAVKIKSFSHQEYNQPQFTSIQAINERMNKGRDLFERPGEDLEVISPATALPLCHAVLPLAFRYHTMNI